MSTNQEREAEASNPEADEIAVLEHQLREAVLASEFFETAVGKLFVEVAQRQINRILKEIVSDKFRKDITGYNNALSDLNAYKKMLRSMQVAASPERIAKLNEKLDNE